MFPMTFSEINEILLQIKHMSIVYQRLAKSYYVPCSQNTLYMYYQKGAWKYY